VSEKAFKSGSVLLRALFCITLAPARPASGLGVKPASANSEHLPQVQPAAGLHPALSPGDPQCAPQSLLTVEWKAGKLSLDAKGAPLLEIVNAIAQQAGLAVEGLDKLQGCVSASFAGVTLSQALENLLVRANYAILERGCDREQDCQIELIIFGQASSQDVAQTGTQPQYRVARQNGTPAQYVSSLQVTSFHTEVEKKLAALQTAAAQDNKEALREALEDPDVNVQSTAFEDLAALDPQGAVEALLRATKSDRPELRIQALQLLDHAEPAEDETILSALANALQDEDASVKRYAIQALASRGEPAMGYLKRALDDSDPSIRLMVVQSVAQQKGGLELVRAAAFSDSDPSVSDTAALIVKQTDSQSH
jgi:hypothetical protein